MVGKGAAIDVGSFGNGGGKGKGPSKALVERLSRQPERGAGAKARAKAAPEAMYTEAAKPRDGSRGAVRFSSVTGKMTAVKQTKASEEMVREGSLLIPKKYLTAAAEAGLGGKNGMYSNMSAVRRELNSGANLGASGGGGGGGGSGGAGGARRGANAHTPTVTNVGGRIHKIGGSSSSSSRFSAAPKPGSNVKHMVQGRSRSSRSQAGVDTHEANYSRGKGVVNNMGGCTNTRTKGPAREEKRKTGVAQLSFSGGSSFVTHHEGKIKHPLRNFPDRKPAKHVSSSGPGGSSSGGPAASSSTSSAPVGISKKLGGRAQAASGKSSGVAAPGTNMSDREIRANYFASKFAK